MTRGEIWWADFGLPFGSEPGFRRPVLIIQDDAFNRSRISTIIIVPLTTNLDLESAPGNVFIGTKESGLSRDSVLVVTQVAALDRQRLIGRAGKIGRESLDAVEIGLKMALGID